MKKTLSLLIFLIICITTITACSSNNLIKHISKTLGIDLTSGTIINSIDTHGGFHGDGITLVEITFSEEDGNAIAEMVEKNKGWSKLPLSENLSIVVYDLHNIYNLIHYKKLSSTSNSVKTPGVRRQFIFYNKCVNFNTSRRNQGEIALSHSENSHLTKNEKHSNIKVDNGLLDYL